MIKKLFSNIIISLVLCLCISPANSLAGQANLAWDPPDISTDVTGYMMHYGTDPGTYSQAIDVGNTTSYTVSNLNDGQTYYFAVTAYNAVRYESVYSNEVSIAIAPSQYLLMISNPGPGQGTVSGPGISCGGTCLAVYNPGAVVTLSAAAAPGSIFGGWSGGGCSGTGLCTVTMNTNITITANFKVAPVPTTTPTTTTTSIRPTTTTTSTTTVMPTSSTTSVSTTSIRPTTTTTSTTTVMPTSSTTSVSTTSIRPTTTTTSTTTVMTTSSTTSIPPTMRYSITASVTGIGGTISPAGTSSVSSGSSLTFSIIPANKYRIVSVTIDGKSVGAVSRYTFSSVAANHTIVATFRRTSWW